MDFSNTSLDLTFGPFSTTKTAVVPILNDAVSEDVLECFSLMLTSTDSAVSLNPVIANITIIDDSDSKCHYSLCIMLLCMCQTYFFASAVVTVGFNTVNHSVLEDAGSVNVTVSILNGTLARNVAVTLSTESDGTATGEFNKHHFAP